jgi:hypothetical protein
VGGESGNRHAVYRFMSLLLGVAFRVCSSASLLAMPRVLVAAVPLFRRISGLQVCFDDGAVWSSGRMLRGAFVSSTSAQALQWPAVEVGGFCYPAFVKVRVSSTASPTVVLVVPAVDCWVGSGRFLFLSVLSQDGGR